MSYREPAVRDGDEDERDEFRALVQSNQGHRRGVTLGVAGLVAGVFLGVPSLVAVDAAMRKPAMHCHYVTTVYENARQIPPEVRQVCVLR